MEEKEIASPIKDIPECWQDEKRMNVLFSPFRSKEQNPIDYESKMKFWSKLIKEWCLEHNQCIFTLKDLQSAFKRKGRTPSCLHTVIEGLLKLGLVQTKDNFTSMTPQTTWTTWAVTKLVKTPLTWSFTKLKEALSDIDPTIVEYVYMEYLQIRGDNLLQLLSTNESKCLYSVDELQHFLEPPSCSINTAELVVHWLRLQGKATCLELGDQTLIKVATTSGSVQITEMDIACYKLDRSKESLLKAIALLESEKDRAIIETKSHLQKGLRQAAKSSLRKKKVLEESITKRMETLDNLELMYSQIKSAHSEAEVLEAYKMGLCALKSTYKEKGLEEDNVADVMDEVVEVNEMHNEVQKALSKPMDVYDDDELEKELTLILSQKESDIKLPEVPSAEIPIEQETAKQVQPIKFPVLEST